MRNLGAEFNMTIAMGLIAAGLMTMNYLEERDVPADISPSSQPHARSQYLADHFPQFDSEFHKLPVKLQSPHKIWEAGKNEWHSLYQLGQCSKLPERWSQTLTGSFGKTNIWGTVQTATASNPISIAIKGHPEFVHIFLVEYMPSHFDDKPWYKSWRTSASEIKSSYVMAINCQSYSPKDRTP